MKQVSGSDSTRLVEARGCTLLRINGSDHIHGKAGSIVRLFIPMHGNKPLKVGLLRHLSKHAGIGEADL